MDRLCDVVTSRMRYRTAPAPAAQMLVAQFATNHDVMPLRGVTDLKMKLFVLFSAQLEREQQEYGHSLEIVSRALCVPKLAR